MDYSLRELECFTAAAEELSFTRAARKLRLAQPPLSRHIRSLEEKLGTPLFQRSARSVSLTAAGSLFHDETRHLLRQLTRAGEATRRFASGQTDHLRLGFVSAVLSTDWVDLLRQFREQAPAVHLAVRDAAPAEQLEAMRQGTLDGGFIGLKPEGANPGIQFVPWRREALMAFVPSGHALARRAEVSLQDLARESWVAVSRESAPTFATHVGGLCASAGFRPRIVQESSRAQAVAVMVAAGVGVALLPASLSQVVGAAVVPLTVKSRPIITHVFARVAGPPSTAMRTFLGLLTPKSGSTRRP